MIAATEMVELSDGTTVHMYASPPGKIRSNLIGQQFGRLLVVGCLGRQPVGRQGRAATCWAARCDCGKLNRYLHGNLQGGHSTHCRACGARTGRPPTHGLSHTTEYNTWVGMIHRCHNPKHQQYKEYGGRGIHVCQRWRDSIEDFLADMGPKPSPKHSIDRFPDGDGNYEPGNCRWATAKEQALNSRHPRFFEHNGERLCIADWAARVGITRERMRQRIRDFPPAVALTVPAGESCKEATALLERGGGAFESLVLRVPRGPRAFSF